jgi:hypothetical protein
VTGDNYRSFGANAEKVLGRDGNCIRVSGLLDQTLCLSIVFSKRAVSLPEAR